MKSLRGVLVAFVLACVAMAGLASSAYATSPPNDDFADAQQLTGKIVVVNGSTVSATGEAGEPTHPGSTTTMSSWYRWTAAANGSMLLSTCANSTGMGVAVYTGSSVGGLTLVGGNSNCAVSVEVTAGTEYRIATFAPDPGSADHLRLIGRQFTRPANDDFSAAQVLTGSNSLVGGSVGGATKEAGEADHYGSTDPHTVWYRWTAPANGRTRVFLCDDGNQFSSAMAVYTGDAVNGLSLVGQGSCGHTFDATQGTTYRIVVLPSSSSWVGTFDLRLKQFGAAPNDNFANAQTIDPAGGNVTGTNGGATIQPGEPNIGSGDATVWYSWTPASSGHVLLDVCFPSEIRYFELGLYTGNDPASLMTVKEDGCKFLAPVTGGQNYKILVDGDSDDDLGDFALKVSMPSRPANDDLADAITLNGQSTSASGNLVGSTKQPSELHPGGYDSGSVWYSWTAPSATPVTIDLCGSDFDSYLGVYADGASFPLTKLVDNDDSGGNACGRNSSVTLNPVSGTTYKIGVYGYGENQFGIYQLRLYPGSVQPVKYTLTSAKTGTGSGTVLGREVDDPNCGTECSQQVNDGRYYYLEAIPDEGSVFAGWSNTPFCQDGSYCSFRMYSSRTVTAVFTDIAPKLETDIMGTGTGTITSSPGTINCPGKCDEEFALGTSVTLTATAAPGSKFIGWSDACSGIGNCVVSMDAPATAVATFAKVAAAAPLKLKVGKAKLNRKKGTAQIPVTVNAAAKITLAGKNLKRRTAATKGARTVRMAVVPVRKLKKALRKKGKAVAKVKITARPTAGGATKAVTKKVTLRLKKRR